MRQSSSRNHRNKGFRLKHALQIGLLVAVCIWLLYQVKHSHDKRRAVVESNSSILNNVVEGQSEVFNLGRKDLPRTIDEESLNETRDEEEDKEEVEEEEEKDIKQEEPEDEGGVGDDEIDEQDQERGDEEEHVEELEGEEDKDAQDSEKEFFDDEEEHERASQEAREENYRRDDVASSVHREPQTMELEGGSGDARGSHEEQAESIRMKEAEVENMANGMVDVSTTKNESTLRSMDRSQAKTSEAEPDKNVWNGTTDMKKELEVGKEGTLPNSTLVESSNQMKLQTNSTASGLGNQTDTQNNSMVLDMITNEPKQNETIRLDSVGEQKSMVDVRTSGEHKPILGETVASEKVNVTAGLEQVEKSFTTSSATNEEKIVGGEARE